MADAVLAIDQGTTNTKALLFSAEGEILASGSAPLAVSYPQSGWAETQGAFVLGSVETAVATCLAAKNVSIAAIGISNQRETILLWDRKSGEPVGPCIIWQCRRSADRISALRTPEAELLVSQLTGLTLDPLFPAAKIGWLLDEVPGARARAERGELVAGTIDTWLLWNLTGGMVFATDFSNASRTQLFDIHRGEWSDALCRLFGVPRSILAEPRSSNDRFGTTTKGRVLPDGVPIHAILGDSHAALFGHGVRAPGAVKATFGTGSSLMTLTEAPIVSGHGLSSTIAWRIDDLTSYALEGNITVSGQAAAWVSTLLGLDDVDALTDLANAVGDSGGVSFVPALAGLGAPYWDPSARGVFAGLSLSTTREHLARATLEAIAFQVADVLHAMERDIGRNCDRLLVDGAATSNALLMQIQADTLGLPVAAASISELSAFGAAAVAGTEVGVWDDTKILSDQTRTREPYSPRLSTDEREARLSAWHATVEQCRLVGVSKQGIG